MGVETLLVLLILVFSSFLGLCLFFQITKSTKSDISFDEAFCVLNTLIEMYRTQFTSGLQKLQKSYAILNGSGQMSPPTDKIQDYARKKQELKVTITKKIIRSLSIKLRGKILLYYTEAGMIHYISVELDKDGEDNE